MSDFDEQLAALDEHDERIAAKLAQTQRTLDEQLTLDDLRVLARVSKLRVELRELPLCDACKLSELDNDARFVIVTPAVRSVRGLCEACLGVYVQRFPSLEVVAFLELSER